MRQTRGVNKKRDKLVDRIIELVNIMIAPAYMKAELINKIIKLEDLAKRVSNN